MACSPTSSRLFHARYMLQHFPTTTPTIYELQCFQQGNSTIWRVRYLCIISLGDDVFIYGWVAHATHLGIHLLQYRSQILQGV